MGGIYEKEGYNNSIFYNNFIDDFIKWYILF